MLVNVVGGKDLAGVGVNAVGERGDDVECGIGLHGVVLG